MSLKDKGNEYFRNGKFEDAIKTYELYIDEDPKADKKVAYTNISFCYYKMQQYKESAEAADNAIEEDQTYAKAYFRKMHAYKEMGSSDYEVYINALLVLKYQPEIEEKTKFDTQTLAKEYKQKWISKLNKDTVQLNSNNCIFELAAENEISQSQSKQQVTIDDWLQKWMQEGVILQSQWLQVENEVVKNQQYGFNLAFLFLNQLKQPQYDLIYQKIKDTQNTLATKMDIESGDENDKMQNEDKEEKSESKQSSSSDQNLFSSPELNGKLLNSNSGKQLQNMKDLTIKDQIAKQQKSKSQAKQHQSSQSKSISKQEPLMSSQVQSVEVLYEKFMTRVKTARDVMVQLLKIIEEILSSGLQTQTKRQLIDLIRQRWQKEIKLMKTSFSKSQQQKVKDLLVSNGMEQYIPDLASKHITNK